MDLEDVKNLVGATTSICTILQFLTGTLVCLKIVQNKTTGDLSPFPFVSGCLSTSLWLRYGFFLQERSIILANTVGASLFFAYVLTFFIYTIKKSTVIRQLIGAGVFLTLVLLYVHHEENFEDAKKCLGIICCVVTILFFASPLASFFHVVRVKNTESLPLPMILSNFIVSLEWVIYGILLDDKFVQIPNYLGCILSGVQLSLFCIYPRTPKGYSSELI